MVLMASTKRHSRKAGAAMAEGVVMGISTGAALLHLSGWSSVKQSRSRSSHRRLRVDVDISLTEKDAGAQWQDCVSRKAQWPHPQMD
jgi:hypothetical protein